MIVKGSDLIKLHIRMSVLNDLIVLDRASFKLLHVSLSREMELITPLKSIYSRNRCVNDVGKGISSTEQNSLLSTVAMLIILMIPEVAA